MKKNVKILLSIMASLVIIILCTIAIANLKEGKKEKQDNEIQEERQISQKFTIVQISNLDKVYNIGRTIDDSLKKIYDETTIGNYYQLSEIHDSIAEKCNLYEAEKNFYIQKAYEVELSDYITVYFANGYVMYKDIKNAPEGDILKEEVNFTLIRDKENKNCVIELYGSNYNNVFKYNDDISKTSIWESAEDNIESLIILEKDISDETLDKEVLNIDLGYWYYEDYKNNKLFSDQNREEYINTKLRKCSINKEEGHVLIDSNNTEIHIKPGKYPMEYEVVK